MLEVRLTTYQSEHEEELFQFRYRIYVDEMHRIQDDADHQRKRITDVLDRDGYNLIAIEGKNLLGAVRVNVSAGGTIPYYSSFYRIADQDGTTPHNTCVVTRMMIAKEVRKQMIAVRLCVAAYELSLWHGIRFGFIDCNEHLTEFFKALGFRSYMGTAVHKEYGKVHPLMLDLHDEVLLRRVNSPFLRSFLNWKLISHSLGLRADNFSRESSFGDMSAVTHNTNCRVQ